MTHGEKWLLGHAAWTALVSAATWFVCWLSHRDQVRQAGDRSYARGWDDCKARSYQNQVADVALEESAGWHEPPSLPAQAQVTAVDFDVYRQTHTVYSALADDSAGLPPGPNVAVAADDVPRPADRNMGENGPGHLTPAQRRRDKHKRRGQYAPDTPDPEPGDDTLTSWFREDGSWEEQLAAIVSEGQTPWMSRFAGSARTGRLSTARTRLGICSSMPR